MGGEAEIPQRNLTEELGQTLGSFKSQGLPAFNKFFNKQPLLQQSRNVALQGLGDVSNLQAPYRALLPVLSEELLPILQSGGALTPEQQQYATQDTRNAFAARGNAISPQSAGAEILNLQAQRDARFNTALGQYLGTATGATQGIQGVESNAINPALATEQTATGTWATLFNPWLNFFSEGFSDNQNAAAAQNIAGANKSSGAVGGGLSALGSIAGAAGIAL